MSGADGLFLDACGAVGSLELACDGWDGGGVVHRVFDQPAILVGQNRVADFCLVHPTIGRRHAYLQIIEGRLYAIDLDSRHGLRWSGVPRHSGWIDAGRPLELGPTTIRVVDGIRSEGDDPGPGPTSRRFSSRHHLVEVALEVPGVDGRPRRHTLDRVLTTIGRSSRCTIRLREAGTSHFACSLVRTPRGVWLVDLLSSQGVTVNGVICRRLRLEDGDVLGIGGRSFRLIYGPAARKPGRARSSAPVRPDPISGPPERLEATPATGPDDLPVVADRVNWELLPDQMLRQLQNRGNRPGDDPAAEPALMMLVQLLGVIYQDQLTLIREEAAQIRRLDREIEALRGQGSPHNLGLPTSSEGPRPQGDPEAVPPDPDLALMRPAPQMVEALVGERIEAWERERQSRWRKVIDLLVRPK